MNEKTAAAAEKHVKESNPGLVRGFAEGVQDAGLADRVEKLEAELAELKKLLGQ